MSATSTAAPGAAAPAVESRALIIFLLAESSIHAGTGSTLSYVDLPIQREAHTDHPVIYASGWKGALREVCEKKLGKKSDVVLTLFGPETDGAGEHGGLAIFQEVRVLLFPVRSFQGVFAWVTCPMVLRRLQRDLSALSPYLDTASQGKLTTVLNFAVNSPGSGQALFCGNSDLLVNSTAVLEDYDFEQGDAVQQNGRTATNGLADWLADYVLPAAPKAQQGKPAPDPYRWWREKMRKDVVVVSDEDFTHFVRMHTEVQPHVQLNEAGTVNQGPWNEESLPSDTVLYTSLTVPHPCDPKFKIGSAKDGVKKLEGVLKQVPQFQICGDRSLGKGFVRATCLA